MADDVQVLRPQGRLDGTSSPELADQAMAMIEQGSRRLLLDFKDLYYISSAGLRAALAVAQRMTAVGGKVAICSANPEVAEVFDIGGFVAVFDMHATAESATARLSED